MGQYRLDRLLLKKAEQGVKIFIVVYKEVTQTMSTSRARGRLRPLADATLRKPCHLHTPSTTLKTAMRTLPS